MNNPQPLPYSTPEAQGVHSSGIQNFVEAVEKNGLELHSLMLLRRGQVIAQGWWSPYAAQHPHVLFSLSKSFTSSAVGLAVSEGLLSVDDRVISFFPDDLPSQVSDNLAAMRVRHLLTMTTGHAEDATGRMTGHPGGDWVKGFLALPVENTPGAPFVYNSAATYMLSAIVQKLTGKPVLDYLRPRLFEPLGIQNPTWQSCPRGINVGGWGLSIRTEDIARFGQMYLQKGSWNGQRILPEAWVSEATSAQVPNGDNPESDWNQGYGYQFWRCRHGAYRGDGAFGQYCVVMPEQEAVLAITGGLSDMQAVLTLAWEHLLPAMTPAPLPAAPESQAALESRLANLRLDPPSGQAASPVSAQVSGVKYTLAENQLQIETVRFDFGGSEVAFTATGPSGETRVSCGKGTWCFGETALFSQFGEQNPVAAGAAWTAADTLLLTLRLYQTPFSWSITCRFTDKEVTIDAAANVSFGPKELPRLVGAVG